MANDVLNEQEQHELETLEQEIESAQKSYAIRVGKALLEIRNRRLYRGYSTFQAYCLQRWNFSRLMADRYIQAYEVSTVISEVTPVGVNPEKPINERQARELAPLLAEPEQLRAVWDETLEKTGGKPTAKAIREVRKIHDERRGQEQEVPLPVGVGKAVDELTDVAEQAWKLRQFAVVIGKATDHIEHLIGEIQKIQLTNNWREQYLDRLRYHKEKVSVLETLLTETMNMDNLETEVEKWIDAQGR